MLEPGQDKQRVATMGFDFGAAFGLHGDALRLRSYRAELIGSNLANAETPNFKARGLDFKALMEEARQESSVMATDSRHMGVSEPGGIDESKLLYRPAQQVSLDGNTVEAQIEKQHFMNNALRYNAELTFLNSRINGLLSAIRGE